MDRMQAEEAVRVLSAEFGLKPPRLVWEHGTKNGMASLTRGTIAIGPDVWRGSEQCLLHEITHFLAWKRVGRHYHDRRFFDCLLDVVRAWFGDPSRYDWHTEYQTLHGYAKAAGMSQAPYHRTDGAEEDRKAMARLQVGMTVVVATWPQQYRVVEKKETRVLVDGCGYRHLVNARWVRPALEAQ